MKFLFSKYAFYTKGSAVPVAGTKLKIEVGYKLFFYSMHTDALPTQITFD